MKCSRPYSCHRCSTRSPLTGKRMPSQYLLWLIAAVTLNDATGVVSANSAPPTPMLVYVNHTLVNFANGTTPGSAGNKYGYEDGSVRRVGNTTHLFVSELIGDPVWVKMRFGHWRTRDLDGAIGWERVGTVVLDGLPAISTANCTFIHKFANIHHIVAAAYCYADH